MFRRRRLIVDVTPSKVSPSRMRYRLSTLLLLAVVVGLCVGWFTERSRREAAHAAKLERLLNGTRHMIHADRTTVLADYYFESPDGFPGIIREKLAWDIYWLWRHETDIDLAYQQAGSTYSAKQQAAYALKVLNCKNEAEFFGCARKMDAFEGNEDIFPELFDIKSAEHLSLRVFVAKSAILIPAVDR